MTSNRAVAGQMLRVGVWSSLTAVTAFMALLTALFFPESVLVTTVLFGFSIAVVCVRHRKGLRMPHRVITSLGAFIPSRFVLLGAAAAVGLMHEHTSWLFVAVALLFAGSLAAEPLVRNINRKTVPYAANIPGLEARNVPSFPYGFLFPLNIVGVLALYAAALFGSAASWFAAAIAVVAVGYTVAVLADQWARIRARLEFESAVSDHVDRIGPVFAVHWNAPVRAEYQLGMWLPYLERLQLPFIIIVRSRDNFREAVKLTDRHPVLLRSSLESLDAVVRPSLRGVFYFNNAIRNAHMVRYSHLVHIQLNHGDSDKAPSFNPVFRMFDYDFVAGQAAIDRFARNGVKMPADMFRIVGRPQVEVVDVADKAISTVAQPTVLYAPTWAGFHDDSSYSSLPVAMDLIDALLARGTRIIFRPHPLSYRQPELAAVCHQVVERLRADAAATGRDHLFGEVAEREMSIFDCFNASDAMVADVSSVVGDYLFSLKPLAMVAVSHGPHEFVEEFPMAQAAYVLDAHTGAFPDLERQLDDFLHRDPLAERRAELKRYYLGDSGTGDYAQRFVDEALDVLGVASDSTQHDARDSASSVDGPEAAFVAD